MAVPVTGAVAGVGQEEAQHCLACSGAVPGARVSLVGLREPELPHPARCGDGDGAGAWFRP